MTIAKLSRTKNNGHNTSLVIISTSLAKLAWEVFRDEQEDIAEYVASFVRTDRKVRRWRDEDKELVIKILSEKADGM